MQVQHRRQPQVDAQVLHLFPDHISKVLRRGHVKALGHGGRHGDGGGKQDLLPPFGALSALDFSESPGFFRFPFLLLPAQQQTLGPPGHYKRGNAFQGSGGFPGGTGKRLLLSAEGPQAQPHQVFILKPPEDALRQGLIFIHSIPLFQGLRVDQAHRQPLGEGLGLFRFPVRKARVFHKRAHLPGLHRPGQPQQGHRLKTPGGGAAVEPIVPLFKHIGLPPDAEPRHILQPEPQLHPAALPGGQQPGFSEGRQCLWGLVQLSPGTGEVELHHLFPREGPGV